MIMPHYRKYGKIQTLITDESFTEGMETGYFAKYKHRAYVVLLYYSAVRKMEALRSLREQYDLRHDRVIFDVGKRLKHGLHTPPLHLPLDAEYMKELYDAIADTKRGKKVFPYSAKTGYNIVSRVWKYPHLFRLTRITQFFLDGWTIAQVRSWTGLTLKALEYYVGLVDTIKMGESLARKVGEII